jgi:hypothetical protein
MQTQDINTTELSETELVAAIHAAHLAAREAQMVVVNRAHECGKMLREAKRRFGAHGSWERWLWDNRKTLGFGKRMAQLYMKIAERWSEIEKQETKRVSHLSVRGCLEYLENVDFNLETEDERADAKSLDMKGGSGKSTTSDPQVKSQEPKAKPTTALVALTVRVMVTDELKQAFKAYQKNSKNDDQVTRLRTLLDWLTKDEKGNESAEEEQKAA